MAALGKPEIEAYIGMTGSGKGVSIEGRLKELKPSRLLIWDPRGEYESQAREFGNLGELVAAVVKAGAGGFKARYVHGGKVPIDKAFGLVCALAFRAGDLVFLAEELAEVTKPSWAPDQWRKCITQGRHRSMHVIGATQRPALIDKTFLGNCTRVRCCMVGYEDDARAMAKELRCDQGLIEGLHTAEEGEGVRIQYVERIRRPPALFAGEIVIKGGRLTQKRQEIKPGGATAKPAYVGPT
jgi:hypothetical protein